MAYKILALLLVKLFTVSVVFFVVSKYIKFVDADLYLAGYYLDDKSTRVQIVQKLAWFLVNEIGPFLTYYFFSLISIIGFFYYYITGGKRWELMLFLFLPSVLIWTSLIGKEAIFYGFFTFALIIVSRYFCDRLKIYDWIFFIGSLFVCMLLRPHYALVLIWLFISIAVLKKWGFQKSYGFLMTLFLIAFGMIFYNFFEELAFRAFSGIDPAARYSRFEYFKLDPNSGLGAVSQQPSFIRFKEELMPIGFLVGILGPMPFEILDRPVLAIFLCEGFLILVSPIIFFGIINLLSIKEKKEFLSIFLLCLIPAYLYLMFIHAPFGLLNFGSAIRWRVNFEAIFYLFPCLLVFCALDEKST